MNPANFTANRGVTLSRRLQWLTSAPKLGLALLVMSVVALLWAVHNAEYEEQRNTLIGDVLWLEQNIRFHLDNSHEKLRQIALASEDPRGGAAELQSRFSVAAQSAIKQHSELLKLAWLSGDAAVVAREPSSPTAEAASAVLADWIDIAHRLERPSYSPIQSGPDGPRFATLFPAGARGGMRQTLVATYSLRRLVDQAVPWWFAEKYHLKIFDDEGATLYDRSKAESAAVVSYDLPVEILGTRLTLRAASLKPPFNATQRFLAIAIVLLAGVVLASLWGIRRQLQGRLAAEQALRESNAFRKSMEDSLMTGLRARDLNGRLIYVNPAFCQMVGFSADELIGLGPPMPYWVPESIEQTLRLHQAVMDGQAPPEGFELKLQRKNGERFDALIYEAPLIDGAGHHVGWMGSVLDITERKHNEEIQRQQQEQLQHTARLVSLGEMASTLAHELNQPLSAISSYATGCRNKLQAGRLKFEEIGEVVDKVAAQSQRAGKIIRQVHDFVKKREPRREPCSVAEIVDEAVALFEPQARKSRVHIGRSLQGGLPDVMADPIMLEQVLINLLRNACDAMAEQSAPSPSILIRVGGTQGQVVVSVTDNGPGIPADRIDKLFTPFYTTKAEGLGMGLAICRSIIEFHHGRLSVENVPERGTCFSFTLPTDSGESS